MTKTIIAALFLSVLLFGADVVHMKTKTHKITVKSMEKGSVYTIEDKSGKQIAKDVTLEQLQASDPKLHQMVKDAIATRKDLHASEAVVPQRTK